MKTHVKLVTLVLALAMVLSLAACGTPGGSSNPGNNPGSANNPGGGTENTKTYQFYGTYTEEGEYAARLNAAFLLNLNEDGTAVCDKYAFSSYDDSDADSNPTYTQSYLSGTWKEAEKDSVPCLQIKLAYVDTNGSTMNDQTCYAYDVAGTYSFDLTFPVVPGQAYSRIAAMEGKEGKTFATDNDFIAAYKATFTAPESIGTFTDADHDGTAYLQADGTILLYSSFDKFAEGRWSKSEDGSISVSIGGGAVEVTMDGNKAAFGYTRDTAGYLTDYTFVCGDVSILPALAGGDTPDEPAEGIAAYEAGGLQLILLDGTRMKVKFPQYSMEREGFTYVLEGNILTVTAPSEEVLGAFGQIWSAMGAEKWTIEGNTATKAE